MTVLGELSAEFAHGVLLVTDSQSSEEIPPWTSSDDMVTSARSASVMRVQHADDGAVRVRVLDDDSDAQGACLYQGSLELDSGVLVLSDATGVITAPVPLRPGTWAVSVHADDRKEASKVDLVFTLVSSRRRRGRVGVGNPVAFSEGKRYESRSS